MVFCTALTGAAVMSLAWPWYWIGPMPDAGEALLIAVDGLLGDGGHFLLSRAFRLAPATILSPLLRVRLVWASLLGWIVSGGLPGGWESACMVLIAAAGLATAWAEKPRARGARRQPPAATGAGKPAREC